MNLWQADFYRCDRRFSQGDPIWQLIVCDREGNLIIQTTCSQPEATADWLSQQFKPLLAASIPTRIQCFRPQTLGLLKTALTPWAIAVEATRHTSALKALIRQQFPQVLSLEQNPPQPLPENLWGEEWRIGTIIAEALEDWAERPIPILDFPNDRLPLTLGLASTATIPGVIIYGGRRSLQLAQWLAESKPYALQFIPQEQGRSGGLILEADLVDRWVLATFDDSAIAPITEDFESRKQSCHGLHFLLVQPDNSGMTTSGLWLLQDSD
jgi:hypothetical protein